MLAAHSQMRVRAKASPKKTRLRMEAATNSQLAPRAAVHLHTLRGGMQQLIDALAARIHWASLRLSTPVSSLEKVANGWRVEALGAAEHYDSVIMASPAWAAGSTARSRRRGTWAGELSAIPYSSSITVNLVYDEAKLGGLPDGFGFLVPASEGRSMLACTFVHRKFLGRTPPGKAVLRAFLGGMRNEALMAETDAALVAIVRRELSEILGDNGLASAYEPEHAQVARWRRAMAQYAVGHLERIARIAAPRRRTAGVAARRQRLRRHRHSRLHPFWPPGGPGISRSELPPEACAANQLRRQSPSFKVRLYSLFPGPCSFTPIRRLAMGLLLELFPEPLLEGRHVLCAAEELLTRSLADIDPPGSSTSRR